MTQIEPGDVVTVEHTTGQAIGRPTTTVHTGTVQLDDEGTPRVDGVPLWTDEHGYFPVGVIVISIEKH